MCANYDNHFKECLLLNNACFMTYGVAYNNSALCKYFREAVLPLRPELEKLFNKTISIETIKECAICGTPFCQSGRSRFCSDLCRAKSKRIQDKNSKRRQRQVSENSLSEVP
jgi:predicted nucleic acid-binding Zn ribbon protein